MLGRISKQLVDRLEPGSLVWDTSLVGFGVRRQLRHPITSSGTELTVDRS